MVSWFTSRSTVRFLLFQSQNIVGYWLEKQITFQSQEKEKEENLSGYSGRCAETDIQASTQFFRRRRSDSVLLHGDVNKCHCTQYDLNSILTRFCAAAPTHTLSDCNAINEPLSVQRDTD